MDGIDQDDVIQILKMLEASTFDELRLEMNGIKLVVSKSGTRADRVRDFKFSDEAVEESKVFPKPAVQKPEKGADALLKEDLEDENWVSIKAPMLGTFYRAPKPGAPPFVEVGQTVAENDSLCIIEVMKLFNTVKASLPGRIVKICAENGEMVEYQQTLFLVAVSEGAQENEEKVS